MSELHPLDPITADEIRTAVALVAADDRYETDFVFAHLRLREPDKAVVLAHEPGAPVDREVEALLVPPGRLEAIEVVVSVTAGEIRSWTVYAGMRPALLFGESLAAIIGVKEDPDWQAAMRRRGIEDFDKVQIDPWPAGSFDSPHEDGRRISRCISYLAPSRRPTTGTRSRSRASSRSSTPARARCSRSSTSAWCRCRSTTGTTCPTPSDRCATT